MAKPEAKIEQSFRRQVKQHGGLALKFVSPGYSGVTDRIAILPGGKVVFVEIKAPGGKLSALQIQFGRMLEHYGCEYYVVWCEEDIKKFIEIYFWHLT